jgi:hypothetical protein
LATQRRSSSARVAVVHARDLVVVGRGRSGTSTAGKQEELEERPMRMRTDMDDLGFSLF